MMLHTAGSVRPFHIVGRIVAAILLGAVSIGTASAYIGQSFLAVPGIQGGSKSVKYKGWIQLEANIWGKGSGSPFAMTTKKRTYFSGPAAPRSGAGTLSLSLDKHSPAFAALMRQCIAKARLPELTYAESSDLARPPAEIGRRPADIPEYFEYKLKDVGLSCPVVADAPEQAFVLRFNNVEWLNYKGEGQEFTPEPAKLPPVQATGKTKTFVLTWFSSAADVSKDQCPVPNVRPAEADYYALMSPEDAAREKAERAPKGGVAANPTDGQLALRGPDKMSVARLPGIVRDPGHVAPQTNIARGFNLDGDDGTGNPPPTTRKHKNYVSEDGQKGIDNQLFAIDGCIKGFRRDGLLTMTRSEGRRTSVTPIMLMVSGIDNEQNDDRVDITIFYGNDQMAKNATGDKIMPYYTYRITKDPEFTQFFTRFHGRIVNGVILTDPVKEIGFNDGAGSRLALYDARIRLEIKPDGTMKGLVGGYQDWRDTANFWAAYSSGFEAYMGFQSPGVYNAFKRAADGLKDPATGEFNGISAAYDLEGVPAFVPPEQQSALLGLDRVIRQAKR